MDVEKRVKRLEWWNRLLVLGMASLLAYGFTTQVVPAKGKIEKIVRAERLEIMGPQGEPAAILGFDDEGAAGLFIRDADGVIRVGVAQFAPGGGGVALHGPGSRGAAVLYLKDSGSLTFYDLEGNPTLSVPEKAPE